MMAILELAWGIPLFPLAAFAAITLFAHRSRRLSHSLAIGGIAAAFILAQIVFWAAALHPTALEHAYVSATLPWLSVGCETLGLGLYLDPAALVMLFMAPLVCLLIFIYSVGYMAGDPRYSRFFAYISLFAAGMLGLVVCNNLLTFFLFWELMGTCSYLLIGFWYEKPSAMRAGLKAFLVTKVGDLFFLLGLLLLYTQAGSLVYADIFRPETLARLAQPGWMGLAVAPATVIALLLFGGTVGKSAQFPLHVWLPDAMEGPTPASALIHAATMVSAGVFLVVRMFPVFAAVEGGMQLQAAAYVGAFTAIFASVIAVAQNDIKRVLAFSTISQLGYMVAALGLGAYVAGVFHLITHAFFKALLFLSAGSVIHGLEYGHHACERVSESAGERQLDGRPAFDVNDMLGMGGLRRRMPRTAAAFLIGGLALAGFPIITAGFWSKDEILAEAYTHNPVIFWMLAAAAGVTAFYTARQLCLTFLGQPRTAAAAHAPESARTMTTPLLILTGFAVSLGWVGIPEHFPVLGGVLPNWFHAFVGGHAAEAPPFFWQPLAAGGGAALGGLLLGWLVYGLKPVQAGALDPLEAGLRRVWLGWLYEALRQRLYFDQLYQATLVRGSLTLAGLAFWLDRTVIDGAVNGAAAAARAVGEALSWVDAHVIDGAVNFVAGLVRSLALLVGWLDHYVVDGMVDFLAGSTRVAAPLAVVVRRSTIEAESAQAPNWLLTLGQIGRSLQAGRVQDYLWLALIALAALTLVFFV